MADRPLEMRRVTAAVELREESGDAAPVLTGYASTFDQAYTVGFFEETITRDAFTRSLQNSPDVRLLIDHEGQPLARTKSGTLTLSTDAHGLAVRAVLDPSDPDVQRLLPKMRRGDLDQMSFAFRVPTGGDEWDFSGAIPKRSIREASLSGGDVSVVTYPANDGTEAQIRARDEHESAFTLAASMLREVRDGREFDDANVARLFDALDKLGVRGAQRPAERSTASGLRVVRASGDLSYSDRESALSDALLAKFAPSDDDDDAASDMWIVDASDSWVVWRQYGDCDPGVGLWRMTYTVGDDDAITFDGDPVQVTAQTSYVPSGRSAATALELARAQALALRSRAA